MKSETFQVSFMHHWIEGLHSIGPSVFSVSEMQTHSRVGQVHSHDTSVLGSFFFPFIEMWCSIKNQMVIEKNKQIKTQSAEFDLFHTPICTREYEIPYEKANLSPVIQSPLFTDIVSGLKASQITPMNSFSGPNERTRSVGKPPPINQHFNYQQSPNASGEVAVGITVKVVADNKMCLLFFQNKKEMLAGWLCAGPIPRGEPLP